MSKVLLKRTSRPSENGGRPSLGGGWTGSSSEETSLARDFWAMGSETSGLEIDLLSSRIVFYMER